MDKRTWWESQHVQDVNNCQIRHASITDRRGFGGDKMAAVKDAFREAHTARQKEPFDSDSDATEIEVTPPLADSVATNISIGYQSVVEMGRRQNPSKERPPEVAVVLRAKERS